MSQITFVPSDTLCYDNALLYPLFGSCYIHFVKSIHSPINRGLKSSDAAGFAKHNSTHIRLDHSSLKRWMYRGGGQ